MMLRTSEEHLAGLKTVKNALERNDAQEREQPNSETPVAYMGNKWK